MIDSQVKNLGCGAGLRAQHYPAILNHWPKIDWFEAISENFMDSGGRPVSVLSEVRKHYPVALHGVSLSIGSTDPLNFEYLKRLKDLIQRIEPAIVSDHLCWSGVEGENLHDLLPLPFTEESLLHVASRVEQVQEFIGRKILIENVSSYLTYRHSEMPEWEFLASVSSRSGCGILLDLNNIYVNSVNHRFDPMDYLNHIPAAAVGQFHLAGHTDMGSFLFDTHNSPVISPVWELYREALRRYGKVPTLIEWDEDLPEFTRLQKEVDTARKIYAEVTEAPVKENASVVLSSLSPEKNRVGWEGKAPALRDIQRWIKTKIIRKEKTLSSAPVEGIFNLQNGVPGVDRILVYAEGYGIRIHDALAEVYPAVKNILGLEKFKTLAKDYADEYPSRYYNLTRAARHLPEFLKNKNFSDGFAYLHDLARLEWQISSAFHAFDEPTFNLSQLSGIPLESWENARLVFQPSVSLLESDWQVLDLWKSRKESAGAVREGQFNKSQRILIARQGLKVRTEVLDEAQYKLLSHLLQGKTLGQACESLADSGVEESLPIAQWFSAWVQDGLILCCEIQAADKT